VVIRATETELDISGSPAELQEIATTLANLTPGQRCRFTADLTAEPAPYDRLLGVFEATASGGPVRVSVVGDAVQVTGGSEMLKRLGSFFEFPEGTQSGTHRHHEWWEGNDDITPDSRPLVLSVA
jgi:hypothetical protein